MEELADELMEAQEKFVALASLHNEAVRGTRPPVDLPQALRTAQAAGSDPNYATHLADFLRRGAAEDRPDYDLPSALRMVKYKNSASVKRLAADELRPKNPKLAQTLDEIANEVEESHARFVEMAANMAAMKVLYSATVTYILLRLAFRAV